MAPKVFRWDESLSVGDKTLDDQHKQLFSLAQVIDEGAVNLDLIRSSLECLLNFAEQHLAHEENELARVGYRDLDLHKKIHNEFRKQLNLLVKKANLSMSEVQIMEVMEEIKSFVTCWLYQHIKSVDSQYKSYLTS